MIARMLASVNALQSDVPKYSLDVTNENVYAMHIVRPLGFIAQTAADCCCFFPSPYLADGRSTEARAVRQRNHDQQISVQSRAAATRSGPLAPRGARRCPKGRRMPRCKRSDRFHEQSPTGCDGSRFEGRRERTLTEWEKVCVCFYVKSKKITVLFQ